MDKHQRRAAELRLLGWLLIGLGLGAFWWLALATLGVVTLPW